jgi:acetyl-CoA carboxylase biotin carboxyl carrier protein
MDLRKLKTLIDLVSESNIHELEITEAEGKVRIVKGGPPGAAGAVAMPGAPAMAAAAAMPAPLAAMPVAAAAPASAEATPEEEAKVIKSPMVGTFYRSASPGAKAFVEEGSVIKEGDAVCIIEAMKIMNEIDSEVAGRISRILCQNGQAVEFGQPLFILE